MISCDAAVTARARTRRHSLAQARCGESRAAGTAAGRRPRRRRAADGSYWFTDPPIGGSLYEGSPDAAGDPSNPNGLLNNRAGQAAGIGAAPG